MEYRNGLTAMGCSLERVLGPAPTDQSLERRKNQPTTGNRNENQHTIEGPHRRRCRA